MGHVEILSTSTVLGLFNLKSGYLFGYSWLLGMSIWNSFIGGFIAYRALPRQQFGALQHRIFPVYFNLSILLSGGLLALWARSHPAVVEHIQNPLVADVAQAYTLAAVVFLQGSNRFVVGPLTSKTMFQRHKLEKAEGKSYNEKGVSAEMKAINKKFAQLHGISSLANLFSFFAVAFHGLWIANKGFL
ncbi:hypothetical protein QCA50_001504 [Cerrena zonata]|uniref:TMEM205-like domain-containing protein n=1 Tax=Cerrena zonata TaxID=2478898 RepID=A0AAW0GQY9_9APHY